MSAMCKHPYINETTLTVNMVESNFQDAKSIEQGYNLLCDNCKRNLAEQFNNNSLETIYTNLNKASVLTAMLTAEVMGTQIAETTVINDTSGAVYQRNNLAANPVWE